MKRTIAILACLLWPAALPHAEQTPTNPAGPDAAPNAAPTVKVTVLTADRATVAYEQGIIVYEGNVIVVDPEMTVKADKMTITYTEENQIRTIVAEGNVKLIRREGTATGDKAVYEAVRKTLVLTGNPKLRRGNDMMTGATITLFMGQNKMVCEPARTIFNPEGRAPLFDGFSE